MTIRKIEAYETSEGSIYKDESKAKRAERAIQIEQSLKRTFHKNHVYDKDSIQTEFIALFVTYFEEFERILEETKRVQE